MQEDLINELKSLAQEILLLKKDDKVTVLRKKTRKIYEKLLLLNYLNNTSTKTAEQPSITMEEKPVVEKVKSEDFSLKSNEKIELFPHLPKIEKKKPTKRIQKKEEAITLESLFVPTFDSIKEDLSKKKEFEDTISLDETEKLFETKKVEPKQFSLNDTLLGSNIQVGLNDRIAFVNKLFNFSQTEFNTVLNNLNNYTNKQEALHYIQYIVKPKYNWKGKEELEERFILIIERKFL